MKVFTTGELEVMLGAPRWRLREIIDGLDAEIPRAGLYRLVGEDLIPAIRERLARRGEQQPEILV